MILDRGRTVSIRNFTLMSDCGTQCVLHPLPPFYQNKVVETEITFTIGKLLLEFSIDFVYYYILYMYCVYIAY